MVYSLNLIFSSLLLVSLEQDLNFEQPNFYKTTWLTMGSGTGASVYD